jgi:protein SCO1/2
VCPTTLSRVARLRARLGEGGDRLNIVFVSVDPEEDTPEQIGRYLTLFGTPIVGLTGTPEALAAARRAYAVHAERVPLEGGGYTIDHTATVFLMGRDGAFVSTLDVHEDDAPALAKLRRLVRS